MATGAYVGERVVTLTNLVPAIDGTSGWTATAGTLTSNTSIKKYSANSLRLYGGTSLPESHICTTQEFSYVAGHKYYIRNEVYFSSDATYKRTSCYWPVAEPNVWNSSTLGLSFNAGAWNMLAMITDRVAAGHTAGSAPLRFDFDNNYGGGYMYIDGIMLIDLTEAFGAGNEPSQTWCNSNIRYFTGTASITYSNTNSRATPVAKIYTGVNGVARWVTKAYVGVDGKARLWWDAGSSGSGSSDSGSSDSGAYLTFSSPSQMSISVSDPGWDGTMEYSLDAQTWNTWSGTSISGTEIYMRGSNNTRITLDDVGNTQIAWTLSGSNISCKGNIETLLDYATVEGGGHPTMASRCYMYMFGGCSSLISAPKLPATSLSIGCYWSMFVNCSNLTTIPELPATTLVSGCYFNMFCNCSKIKLSTLSTWNDAGVYTQPYRIPTSGDGMTDSDSSALTDMFTGTGGTFTGTPEINTTYYLHNNCSIA